MPVHGDGAQNHLQFDFDAVEVGLGLLLAPMTSASHFLKLRGIFSELPALLGEV
jgi:hypothetical protein